MEDLQPEHDFDARGDRKVDADGALLTGKTYLFATFTLPRHPTQLYAFSLDAAKALGFRDTYSTP